MHRSEGLADSILKLAWEPAPGKAGFCSPLLPSNPETRGPAARAHPVQRALRHSSAIRTGSTAACRRKLIRPVSPPPRTRDEAAAAPSRSRALRPDCGALRRARGRGGGVTGAGQGLAGRRTPTAAPRRETPGREGGRGRPASTAFRPEPPRKPRGSSSLRSGGGPGKLPLEKARPFGSRLLVLGKKPKSGRGHEG